MHKLLCFVIILCLNLSPLVTQAKTIKSSKTKSSKLIKKKSKKKKRKKKKRRKRKKKVVEKSGLDSVHEGLSKNLFLFTNNVDQFFGGRDADDNANGSRLRLYVEGQQRESMDPTSDYGFRFNLVLPQFQRRIDDKVKEILGQDEESKKKEKKKKSKKTKKKKPTQENPGVMQALYEEAQTWRMNAQTGVNVDWPLQTYIRLKAFKTIFFTKWQLKPLQEVSWVDRNGWGTRTQLTFDRKLTQRLLYRWDNRMNWSELEPDLAFSNGPSLIYKIDGSKGISYNFRVNSINNVISHVVASYVASIGYRQRLYKKWLFMSITPQIAYAAANNFVKDPSLTIRFEAVFGSI
jgi:hypothetical protein